MQKIHRISQAFYIEHKFLDNANRIIKSSNALGYVSGSTGQSGNTATKICCIGQVHSFSMLNVIHRSCKKIPPAEFFPT